MSRSHIIAYGKLTWFNLATCQQFKVYSKPKEKKVMSKIQYFHITVSNLTLGSKVKVTGKNNHEQ